MMQHRHHYELEHRTERDVEASSYELSIAQETRSANSLSRLNLDNPDPVTSNQRTGCEQFPTSVRRGQPNNPNNLPTEFVQDASQQWLQPQGILGRLGRHPAEMARYGPGSALENLSHETSANLRHLRDHPIRTAQEPRPQVRKMQSFLGHSRRFTLGAHRTLSPDQHFAHPVRSEKSLASLPLITEADRCLGTHDGTP